MKVREELVEKAATAMYIQLMTNVMGPSYKFDPDEKNSSLWDVTMEQARVALESTAEYIVADTIHSYKENWEIQFNPRVEKTTGYLWRKYLGL